MLTNRTGWRDQDYPNYEVRRFISHFTISGKYPEGGEPLACFVQRGRVSAIYITPQCINDKFVMWNGSADDPKVVICNPDLTEVDSGWDIPTSDLGVEVVVEVGE